MAAKKKAKAKTKARAKAKTKTKSKAKPAIKKPRRNTEPEAPLAEMDAAWQSLLETAIARHGERGESAASAKPARKK